MSVSSAKVAFSKDMPVTVVGLGASGVAAALLASKRGARVLGMDTRSKEQLGAAAAQLEAGGVALSLGAHDEGALLASKLIVVSPGVPQFPALERALAQGIPVLGEVEFAVQSLEHPAPIVAIGGTNGKSTVTTLVGAMLGAAGGKVFVGGNLGEPLASHTHEAFSAVVLEVSSFQMERVATFKPKVSALLNITADHLDRYAGFDDYAQAKGQAFLQQGEGDVAVVPAHDAGCLAQAQRGKGRVVTFGPGGDVDVSDVVITRGKELYPRAEIALQGGHNALNCAAAIACAREMGVSENIVRAVLREFTGLPHRMAFVATVGDVRYYDDSKGTNVGASVTALLGTKEPKVVLIAGGKDKGGSYEPLVSAMAQKGRAIVLIGEAKDLIAKAMGTVVPAAMATDMADAVRRAREFAKPGDAVLLSPACASFDMFRDYKHRGDEFVAAVRALGKASVPPSTGTGR
jgi:UDP-N-acetylmuramoylalanine--D-glutamate ligase